MKKTTTIIVTRDESDGEGIIWKSSAKPKKDHYGEFPDFGDRLFGMGCIGDYVFRALFPSRPRKGQKKKYRVTVEEI